MRRESRVKRLPRASVSRFLFPPRPQMHLRVRGCGGADDRALKAWEKKLHGSRTRIGKAGEARGAGVSAKEVPAPPPPPPRHIAGGGGGMGSATGSAPRRPHPGRPRSPTHSNWVKALSPSGTAVSPFPEQSTRRSPSQLQGAAQRGGAAPLGSAEPRSPRARKQSNPSGPGIAAAATRAGLSRGAARSARLRRPPTPPAALGGRPAGWAGGSPLSAVTRARLLQQSAAAAQERGAPEFRPSRCSMEAQRQPQVLPRLRPAGPAGRSCGGRALPSHPPPGPRPPAAAALQGCGAQTSAMPAPRPSPRPALAQTPRLFLALLAAAARSPPVLFPF